MFGQQPRNMDTQVEFSTWLTGIDDNTIFKLGMCILGVDETAGGINNYFTSFMTMYNDNHGTSINTMDGTIIVLSEIARRWLNERIVIEPVKEG